MTSNNIINIRSTMTASQPPNCALLHMLPSELHVNILTYLRAFDLVSVQLTCRFYHDKHLVHAIVQHTATHVYPPELTHGFDTPLVAGSNQVGPLYTYENLKNMEMLVVARVLSRPEPASGFYVSKSWCKAALRWLEVQQESFSKKPARKLSKKQQRIRNRRLSDVSPPWPNVNSDLLCTHDNLQRCGSKASRARRRLLDKQAWKVLKKLYPDSMPLESNSECLQCLMEEETRKKNLQDQLEKERQERKRPLSCPHVRALYTRSRGVPLHCLSGEEEKCPLVPGEYHVLPRAWCHYWRRYFKTEKVVERPCAPCASVLLCDAHRLPLIPAHLESYLYGETSLLLGTGASEDVPPAAAAALPAVGRNEHDDNDEMVQSLRAAGLSATEVASQRMAMLNMERRHNEQTTPQPTKDQLDRENSVVVEILTQQEWIALQQWWPKAHSNFSLRFTVEDSGSISWSTPPCRDCDSSGRCSRSDLVVKNRARGWVKKSSDKSRAPASLEFEY